MDTPNSMRILYKASLKSMNSRCTASLYNHFFSSIWQLHKIWSVVHEHGNEPSGSIKCWKVLEQLHNWRLLKNGSTPWVIAQKKVFPTIRLEGLVLVCSLQKFTLGFSSGFSLLVESSLMLRPTVSRPVCLGIKHPTGAYDQVFVTVRQTCPL
jgi:hypothetical protein